MLNHNGGRGLEDQGMHVRVNEARVEEIAELLSRVTMEQIVELEKLDPQYNSVQKLKSCVGRGNAVVYALLVGLVSYRLTIRGEEWWDCLARLICARRREPPGSLEEVVSDTIWFLENCKGAVLSLEAKKRRVQRVYRGAGGVLSDIMREPDLIFGKPDRILSALSRVLGVDPGRKTIAFSYKMAYYAASGGRPQGEVEAVIPIPVDVRVACISYSSKLVDANSYRDIISRPQAAQEAWARVSKLSGIPTLNLDTLLWLTGWAPRDLNVEEARERIASLLSKVMEHTLARSIARAFSARPCR